jgi:tight adherence protein B
VSGRRFAAAIRSGVLLGVVLGVSLGAVAASPRAVATPADRQAGEPRGRIDGLIARDGTLRITFSATQGTEALDLDPATLRVTAQPDGGRPATLPGELVPASRPDAVTRNAMLVLDTSRSMTPSRMAAAKAAAEAFLGTVPPDVRVGLVTFGDPATLLVRPTLDRGSVRGTVRALEPSGDTAMFEAVIKATLAMPGDVSRSIVLLTDGVNDDRTPPVHRTPDAARKALRDTNTVLTGVAVDDGLDDVAALAGTDRALFARDGGLKAALSEVFAGQAEALTKQVVVQARVPADLAGRSGTLTVSGRTTSGAAVTAQQAPARFGAAPAGAAGAAAAPAVARVDEPAFTVGTPVVVAALIALFLSSSVIIATAAGLLGRGRREDTAIVRRLAVYTLSGPRAQTPPVAVTEQTTALGSSAVARGAVGLAERLARGRNVDRALDARLEAAGLPLRTAEWAVLHTVSAIAGLLLCLLIGAGRPLPALLGLVIGVAAPWVFLTVRQSRRENAFAAQLPDILQLLAGSLRAGYSLPQAMDTVVREARAPIGSEFNRALTESRLGVPPEDALEAISRRTRSRDFAWIVMAIRIQRDVGGNLAELLTTVADTLRERQRLRRHVSALSAEGRLSGIILASLPVVFSLYLLMVEPEYLRPLFTTPLGLLLILFGTLMLVVGGIWMARVVKVRV